MILEGWGKNLIKVTWRLWFWSLELQKKKRFGQSSAHKEMVAFISLACLLLICLLPVRTAM